MPGVVALAGYTFLAALGVGAASAAVIMGVGAAVITLTVASMRRAANLKDTGDVGRVSGQTVMVRSTEVPRIIAFGETQVGGVISFLNTTGNELRSLYYEIVHTGHEIDSFIGWYLDDKYVPIADVDDINAAGDGSVDANSGGHGLDDYNGTPVLYLRGHLGTDSQAVDSMLDSAFAEIDSNHRHRGCAKTVVRCELVQGGESKWQGRSPQSITAVMRGMKCYDPRLDSTFPGGSGSVRLATPSTWPWTDNPALIWGTYRILATPLGPEWSTDRPNWQSVFTAANVCDASVAIPTATTEKRFRCDLTVDTAMEPREVITKILATMGGKERQFNGQWHVYAAGFPSTDFALTDDDVIGELQYRKQPQIEDRYNQVKPRYIDRERLWKPLPGIAVNNTTLRTNRDKGRTLSKELELDGVTREYQAQRLAKYALNQADDTGILVFQTGYNGLNIRVGDTGTVSIAELGFVAKTFRCVGWKWIDFVGAELTLKEDSSGNYSDPAEGEYSTRTAAGDIVFGTVTPWYLLSIGLERWTPVLSNVSRDGQVFTKTGGADSTYDAAFRSLESYARCAIQWKFGATNLECGVGLTTDPAVDDDFDTIDYWMHVTSSGTLRIYQNGTQLGADRGAVTTSDQCAIVCDGPSVRFYRNDELLDSVTHSGAALYADSSFYRTGATVNSIAFGQLTGVGTGQLDPNAAEVLVSSQPSDGTEVLPSISYSGGGTLVDYSTITSVSWTNDTGESIDVVLRQSARVQLASSDSLIGRKLAMRWSLNGGGSWSYDGTNTDNINITAADWQPKATQRTVAVADGETIDAESIVVLIIPDPTTGDPADVQYRGLSLSIEAKLR